MINIPEAIMWALNFIQNTLTDLLKETIFKANPELAQQYGSAISTLVFLTALYILLTLFSTIRKVIGYIILIGWLLLLAAFGISLVSGGG